MASNRPLPETRGRFAVVIPVYNHASRITGVVREALQLDIPVIVVDDGSTDATVDRLEPFLADVKCIRHRVNRGKGAALVTGFREALNVADWAITLDADGQHQPADARRLMTAADPDSRPVVVGVRREMRRARAPWTSRFGRRFSNFWVRLAGGPPVADSQSGFRIYPLPEILDLDVGARRFQYEIEVLVKAYRQGIPVIEFPIGVTYPAGGERISHFHPFFDFLRNFGTFSRLITQRVLGCRTGEGNNRPWG